MQKFSVVLELETPMHNGGISVSKSEISVIAPDENRASEILKINFGDRIHNDQVYAPICKGKAPNSTIEAILIRPLGK